MMSLRYSIMSRQASRLLLTVMLAVPAQTPCRGTDFAAVEHQRHTIYHSPQSPGFTSWCGAWIMPDGDMMVCFTQATGPVEGRPQASPEIQHRLGWPPDGHPDYDMTGLDLRNVHLRSKDAGGTWTQVSADAFVSCMNGVSGEAETGLPDGSVIRAVFGFYLPFNPELPQTGFLQRSADGTKTWGPPELPMDPKEYSTWPRRLRVLRDGRLVLLFGGVKAPAGSQTRTEYSRIVRPMLAVSSDQGRTWLGPIDAVPADQPDGWTEEFDVAELANDDLLCVFRRANDTHRWQNVLHKSDSVWVAASARPSTLPQSGHPELLRTSEGFVLHMATSGIHATVDAGATWCDLNIRGTAYYPRSIQNSDGRIFVFGHVGGDDAYGRSDQSIVMDSFRLQRKP